MKRELREMIEIYKPEGKDWMGFKLSKSNPYTYHHIKEKKNGGKVDINNGAILTKRAHRLLNFLEIHHPDIYNLYQQLFVRINERMAPLDESLITDIYDMYDTYLKKLYENFDEKEIKPMVLTRKPQR